ncbi:MAG: F0F1 ATP synthase subunit C [Alphaproteobacteria bacterium]|nr:F0F1 ATP synthase subunit C [Alphaproteobacteria bacterium]
MLDPSSTSIAVVSIATAGFTIAIGGIAVEVAEGMAVKQALASMTQQPDEADNIRSTLFVSIAMLETVAIYCLLIAMILLFANPFWSAALTAAGAGA